MLIYVHNNPEAAVQRSCVMRIVGGSRTKEETAGFFKPLLTNCVLHKFREDYIRNSSTLVVSIPPAETVPCIFLHFSGVSMYYSLRIKIV